MLPHSADRALLALLLVCACADARRKRRPKNMPDQSRAGQDGGGVGQAAVLFVEGMYVQRFRAYTMVCTYIHVEPLCTFSCD